MTRKSQCPGVTGASSHAGMPVANIFQGECPIDRIQMLRIKPSLRGRGQAGGVKAAARAVAEAARRVRAAHGHPAAPPESGSGAVAAVV